MTRGEGPRDFGTVRKLILTCVLSVIPSCSRQCRDKARREEASVSLSSVIPRNCTLRRRLFLLRLHLHEALSDSEACVEDQNIWRPQTSRAPRMTSLRNLISNETAMSNCYQRNPEGELISVDRSQDKEWCTYFMRLWKVQLPGLSSG